MNNHKNNLPRIGKHPLNSGNAFPSAIPIRLSHGRRAAAAALQGPLDKPASHVKQKLRQRLGSPSRGQGAWLSQQNH